MKVILLALIISTLSVADMHEPRCEAIPSYGVCLKALQDKTDGIAPATLFCLKQDTPCDETPAHGMCVGLMVESKAVDLIKAEKICLGLWPDKKD